MPRRKPNSGKQKKEQQQIKRAIKRGDLPAPEPNEKPSRNRRSFKVGPTGKLVTSTGSSGSAITTSRKLQSAFIKLPPKFLEITKAIASSATLIRPIPYDVALFRDFTSNEWSVNLGALSCPKRPKWRFDMSKKEVENNEEGIFKKWLVHTDGLIEQWQKCREPRLPSTQETEVQYDQPLLPPPSPTYFERNLEVWRQLWRVTEISQIILVLLDSRWPLLHFPPSLEDYLANRKFILVLTKTDITGPTHVNEWIKYFKANLPDLRIVEVESYIEKEITTVHQGKRQFEPHLPDTYRRRLVETIKEVHADMLLPPDRVTRDPDLLKKWIPPVKRNIDWTSVLNASGDQVETVVKDVETPKTGSEYEIAGGELDFDKEPEMLTVGMIGQPNVGKSSLLNALFGARRVRASKTPGKTKHFQTLYWTNEVRLVDCPGIVMPNYVPMETQALSGILPVSKVSAIPACINYAAKVLPLERIFQLTHPAAVEPIVVDKRTWREGIQPLKPKGVQWTTVDILTAYANSKGWVTAKAGRPDIHRAGNAILRALAEGRVSWAFWPAGTSPDIIAKECSEADMGAWLADKDNIDEEDDQESGEDEVERVEVSETSSEADESEENFPTTNLGRFGALQDIEGSESEDN